MKYKANTAYQNNQTAGEYDDKRFTSIKGSYVDRREKKLMINAIQSCDISPPARIVDVPTGTARLAIELAALGYNVTGVDISKQMIQQGIEKIKGSALEKKISFELGDGESLPFKNSEFDCSVSLRLFGHVPPSVRVNILKELARVSSSCVVVAYYSKYALQQRLRKQTRRRKDIPWHPASFSDIKNELSEAGLRMIKTKWLLPYVSETLIVVAKKHYVT